MKIKCDFVTNSSSASFIMYFRTNDDTVEEFVTRIEKLLSDISYHRNFSNARIERVTEGIYRMIDWTSMYNYNDDMPNYMKSILVEYHLNRSNIFKNGIKEIIFEISDDY